MNQTTARRTAPGAVRSEMRSTGYTNSEIIATSAQDALKVLDDIARTDSQLIASEWFINASDNQIKLFSQEWRAYQQRGY